jgi:hypothetical protein
MPIAMGAVTIFVAAVQPLLRRAIHIHCFNLTANTVLPEKNSRSHHSSSIFTLLGDLEKLTRALFSSVSTVV